MRLEIVARCTAIALAGCLVLASPDVSAQSESAEPESADPTSSTLRFLHDYNKRHILAAADEIPADNYSFRPSEEARSIGELLAHIADVQFLLCSSGRNEPNPGGTGDSSVENSKKDKAGIVTALRSSFDYCDETYRNLTDAQLGEPSRDTGPAAGPLTLSVYHAGQHYGHLTVSMRMLGLTPPSSRPRDGASESQSDESDASN